MLVDAPVADRPTVAATTLRRSRPRRAAWRRRPTPLPWRIGLMTMTAVLAGILVTGVAGYVGTRVTVFQTLDEQLYGIADDAVAGMPHGGAAALHRYAASNELGYMLIALVEPDGDTAVPTSQPPMRVDPAEVAAARADPKGRRAWTASDSDGHSYRYVAETLPTARGQVFVLARRLDRSQEILQSLWRTILVIAGPTLALGALFGRFTAAAGLRPVRRLTAQVERIAATRELVAVPVSGTDDLGRLAVAFNHVVEELKLSQHRQRQLVADAGHELRTPLTSMRMNVDLLLADAAAGRLPERARTEILTEVATELSGFSRLASDLLVLSSEHQATAPTTVVDLADLVDSAVRRARLLDPGARMEVRTESYEVHVAPEPVEQAILHLLDNAIKFSPAGATVTVLLAGGRLTVTDRGPGIDEADLPFVFDRFFRSDRSRATPGTGLGLTVVAQTVAAHGGTIRASRAPGGGAELVLQLPPADPDRHG